MGTHKHGPFSVCEHSKGKIASREMFGPPAATRRVCVCVRVGSGKSSSERQFSTCQPMFALAAVRCCSFPHCFSYERGFCGVFFARFTGFLCRERGPPCLKGRGNPFPLFRCIHTNARAQSRSEGHVTTIAAHQLNAIAIDQHEREDVSAFSLALSSAYSCVCNQKTKKKQHQRT